MPTETRQLGEEQPIVLEAPLGELTELLEQPEHQGVPLIKRDWVLLFIVTVAVPALITVGWAVAQ